MVENSSGNVIGLLFTFLLFLLLISAFVINLNFRSWIRNREQEMKTHLAFLRKSQEYISNISKESEIYSEDDPEPFGPLIKQITADLIFSSSMLGDLFALYGSNRAHLSQLSSLKLKMLMDIPTRWRDLNNGFNHFQAGQKKLEHHVHLVEKNFERLSNITLEVENKCRKILELILVTKQKLVELDELKITDDGFNQVARSLDEWEKTALQQIPVHLLAGKHDSTHKLDKVYIAKAFRLLNTMEPEIKGIGTKVSEWRSDFDRIHQIKKEIITDQENILAIIKELSQNKVLSVDWGPMEDEATRLSHEIVMATDKESTVSEFTQFLTQLNKFKKELTENLKQVKSVQQAHQDLAERLRKRQPFHQLEWAKNAVQRMEEAKDINPENWPGVQVVQLRLKLMGLVQSQANVIIKDPPRNIEVNQLAGYLDVLRGLDRDYEQLSSDYHDYFQGLQELNKQESDLKTTLSQYYASLRQLIDLVLSNPSIKKMALSDLQKYLQSIEELNLDLADRSKGRLEQKVKRWKSLALKINRIITKIHQKLVDENRQLFTKLRGQVDLLQDYLNLDEAIFHNSISLLKEDKASQTDSLSEQDENLPLLEKVNKIKRENNIWQRLIASTNALSEISGPISDRFEKLNKNRQDLSDLMKMAEEKVPDHLSWPPTTKRMTLERSKFESLEEKYRNLKTNRKSAVQLVAALSDLAEQYRELFLAVRGVVNEAETEQKKFIELDKRLNVSVEMWQKVSRAYKVNSFLVENIQDFLANINRDYLELQKRYKDGRISYPQAYQMFRIICRKIDQEPVEFDDTRIIDISGEIQQKL